jgi:hypothetical protein
MAGEQTQISPTRQRSELPVDGRQSAAALAIARGTARMFWSLHRPVVPEVTLPTGRRADLVALSDKGDITMVEIKSSVEDFRADQKWPEYLDFCDELYFAVDAQFPLDLLPDAAGIIIADRYGAEVVRPAPENRLAAARRRMMTLRLARMAALRLQMICDPDIALEAPNWG